MSKVAQFSSGNRGYQSESESSECGEMDDSPLLQHEADTATRDTGPPQTQYGAYDPPIVSPTDQNSVDTLSSDIEQPHSTVYLYFLAFFSAIGGFLFGYDTGVISGAMLLIRDEFKLSIFYQELIVSATVGAAAVFAFLGGYFNDLFGRRPIILAASIIFTVGAVIMGAAVNKEMLLTGRLTVGMGIGFASMTVPMYIAENSPPQLRGRLVTLNNAFITGGQFIASVVDGIFSYNKQSGWRYMLGLAGVPSLIQFVGFMFLPESPRWLVSKGRLDEAQHILMNIRGTPQVSTELTHIRQTCQQDQLIGEGGAVIWQILKTKHVRKALFVGCMLQVFQQITGINTVMYYSATIIKMSGIQSNSAAIWLACITAGTNFVFTFVGLYLVEKIGRRKLTLGSLTGTMISLAVLAIGFQLAAYNTPAIDLHPDPPMYNESSCFTYSNCGQCMMDEKCGFCYDIGAHGVVNSSCVPVLLDPTGHLDPRYAQYGRCSKPADPYIPHRESWAYSYCPTNYAWMSIFGLILYLAFFAPGMGPMPWTINSEIYPLWARSTGNSITTMTNWLFNLLISMTFLTLTQTLTRYGAFWLYSGFALVGLVILGLVLPETKGKSLEEVEDVFKKPWCSRQCS